VAELLAAEAPYLICAITVNIKVLLPPCYKIKSVYFQPNRIRYVLSELSILIIAKLSEARKFTCLNTANLLKKKNPGSLLFPPII
jgi:hypothetical protein